MSKTDARIYQPRGHYHFEQDDFYDRAKCRTSDVDFFAYWTAQPDMRDPRYPTWKSAQEETERAKQVCHTCPVKGRCLDLALRNNEQRAVYGGLTAGERYKVKRARGDQ